METSSVALAAAPPPGVAPGRTNAPTLDHWLWFTMGMTVALSFLVMSMRLFTRWHLLRTYLVEDFLALLSWAGWTSSVALYSLGMRYGFGMHLWDITESDYTRVVFYSTLVEITYGPLIALLKISILLQFLHMFVLTRQFNMPMWLSCWGLIIVNAIFYGIETIWGIVACFSRSPAGTFSSAEGRCFVNSPLPQASGIFNIITDLAITLLPLPSIYNLRISTREKLAIASLFAAGLLACVSSAMRAYYTWVVDDVTPDLSTGRPADVFDESWVSAIGAMWAWAEACTGFLVFCLPSTPAFYQFVKEKWCQWRPKHSHAHPRLSDTADVSDHLSTMEHVYPTTVPLPGLEGAKGFLFTSLIRRTESDDTHGTSNGTDDSGG